jgi:hypothetical protein
MVREFLGFSTHRVGGDSTEALTNSSRYAGAPYNLPAQRAAPERARRRANSDSFAIPASLRLRRLFGNKHCHSTLKRAADSCRAD